MRKIQAAYKSKVGVTDLMSTRRIAVVMPAFNEGLSIQAVVSRIQARALIIVVDDGSTDDTSLLASKAGALVVRHSVNKGYDAALDTGIRTALNHGCAFAITMDADGQHDPSLLDRFVFELESGADLVIGVRDRTQRWSEMIFAFIGKNLWGLQDPLCGMKGYRLELFRNIDKLCTYNSVGTELSIRAIKTGVNLTQIPIRTNVRDGISRFGGGFRANMRIIRALILGLTKAKSISP